MVLIEKLKILADEIDARDRVAQRYSSLLEDIVPVPRLLQNITSAWAQYTVLVPAEKRARIVSALKEQGVPTMIYYPKPLHRQTAYRDFPVVGNGLPVSERLADEVLSLPMHPYLDDETQDRIVSAFRHVLRAS